MRRGRFQNAVLLIQREHLLVWPLAEFVEVLHSTSRIFWDVLAACCKVHHAREAFEFAIDGSALEGATLVANGGLLPTMIAILFDQLRGYFQQHESSEKLLQV